MISGLVHISNTYYKSSFGTVFGPIVQKLDTLVQTILSKKIQAFEMAKRTSLAPSRLCDTILSPDLGQFLTLPPIRKIASVFWTSLVFKLPDFRHPLYYDNSFPKLTCSCKYNKNCVMFERGCTGQYKSDNNVNLILSSQSNKNSCQHLQKCWRNQKSNLDLKNE